MFKALKKYFSGLTKSSFFLALASFFADTATEMMYPILPIFITQVIMAPASIVGIIEGVAQGTQNIVQGFSGMISDRLQKRKPVAILGYSLASISKPFIGLSFAWPQVLAARFFDRLGTGIRSAPRDALIASSVEDRFRGKAFGIEGIGDNLGAVFGPLLAALLLYSFHFNLRLIFILTIIPGALAVVMMMLVTEKKPLEKTNERLNLNLGSYPAKYWRYLLVTGVFGLGNISSAFLILKAKNVGISTEIAIFIYALLNFVAALSSYPAGSLSDRFGRKIILLTSFLIAAITFLVLSSAQSLNLLILLFVAYGIFQGVFRTIGRAYATDFVPPALSASGVGWYSAVLGITSMTASIIVGQLWVRINPSTAFIYGASFSFLGSFLLFLV